MSVLDASLDRIERGSDGRSTVQSPTHRRWRRPRPRVRRRDLRHRVRGAAARSSRAGCQTVGQSRLPVQTPFWESTTVPASSSAGRSARAPRASRSTACPRTQGPSMAPATTPACWPPGSHRRTSGSNRSGPTSRPTRSRASSAAELSGAPELFHQRGYLARVLTADPAGGMRDDGVQPLAYVLDQGGPDALAATLEGDGSGRSTRSSTRGSVARSSSTRSSPIR